MFNIQTIPNGYNDSYGDALRISYVDDKGESHFIELHQDEVGCMVIGEDEDEKYTF